MNDWLEQEVVKQAVETLRAAYAASARSKNARLKLEGKAPIEAVKVPDPVRCSARCGL